MPSSKKSLFARGFTFGWLNMSRRHPEASRQQAAMASALLPLHIEHPARPQPLEKDARRRLVELRVLRLDAQEVAVAAREREARHVEHRVVRRRQTVQGQHPENGEDAGD